MELYKKDIYNIGHTAFQEEGNLSIVTDIDNCGVEEILLREILKTWGNYQIISVDDFWEEDDEIPSEVLFKTNLPWEDYSSKDKI